MTSLSDDCFSIDCTEQENGSLFISVQWDNNDPRLSWWTCLKEEQQRAFFVKALKISIQETLPSEKLPDDFLEYAQSDFAH